MRVGTAQIDDAECLIAALFDIDEGRWVGKVEIHAEPQPLYGFQGDAREQKAHVIIRRQHIPGLPNDVGFLFTSDGCSTIISDYDKTRFSPAWVAKLEKLAAVARIEKTAKAQGYPVTRRALANGDIQVVAIA